MNGFILWFNLLGLRRQKRRALAECWADIAFVERERKDLLDEDLEKLRDKMAEEKRKENPSVTEVSLLSDRIMKVKGVKDSYRQTSELAADLEKYISVLNKWIRNPFAK